jgi:hypothetical protein
MNLCKNMINALAPAVSKIVCEKCASTWIKIGI